MSNRVIKDSILTSQSMARLSAEAERHFFRLILLKDDWGCMEATAGFVKGHCYSYHETMTLDKIITLHNELEQNGDLRFWQDGDRYYGIFIGHEKHDNRYGVTASGKQTRHRRKTPEPPKDILSHNYKAIFCKSLQIITDNNTWEKQVSYPVPEPVPNPEPKHKKELKPLTAKEPPSFNAVKYFMDKYLEIRQTKYIMTDSKAEAGILTTLYKKTGVDEFKRGLEVFLKSNDKFHTGGFTSYNFAKHINIWLAVEVKPQARIDGVDPNAPIPSSQGGKYRILNNDDDTWEYTKEQWEDAVKRLTKQYGKLEIRHD